MALTSDQVRGMLDRAASVLATMFLAWCVKKGFIGESDSAALLPAVILLPSLAWGWWVNRNKALVQSAANVPGTLVVTTPALAAATPESNIVPATSTKVVDTATGAVVQPSLVDKPKEG